MTLLWKDANAVHGHSDMAFSVTNIFAWRETDPRKMEKVSDPVGPKNDSIILKTCLDSDVNIAAWGTHGSHLDRGVVVKKIFLEAKLQIFSLGISKVVIS